MESNQNVFQSSADQQQDITYKCGVWFRKYWGTILVVLVLIAISSFLLGMWAEDELEDVHMGSRSYAFNLKHRKCKTRGGCSRKCPFMTEDDPRKVMCKQVENIKLLSEVILKSDADEQESIDERLAKFTDAKLVDSIKVQLDVSAGIKARAKEAILLCERNVSEIDKTHGSSELITPAVVAAKNKTTAYEALAAINKSMFVNAVLHSMAVLTKNELEHVVAPNYTHIHNFDQKSAKCIVLCNKIMDKMPEATAKVAVDYKDPVDQIVKKTNYTIAFDKLLSPKDETEVIDAMSSLLNIKKEVDADANMITGLYEDLMMQFELVNMNIDRFSNDLPNTMAADEVSRLIINDDYNTALIKTALEPEVVNNHKKFATERSTYDSGGGVPSVRDDDNDIVKWVGLFGRPTYRRSDGSSADQSSEPLRSIPSDNPTDMMRMNTPKLSFA